VTLSTRPDRAVIAEDAADLRAYLHGGAHEPAVTHSLALRCPAHGPDAGSWFYVEADAAAGVARRRCVACARTTSLLDSAQRWTYPSMCVCAGCGQSLFELAAGIALDSADAADAGRVRWLTLAGRCVECGRVRDLVDTAVPLLTVGDVAAHC
jgi:hypothetical protein